jgi:hypothetical protein
VHSEALQAALLEAGALEPKRRPPRQTSARKAHSPVAPPSHAQAETDRGHDTTDGSLEDVIAHACAAAAEWQQRETLERFLAALALRSLEEEPDDTQAVRAWIAAVQRGLNALDPMVRTINTLKRQCSERAGAVRRPVA